MIVTVGSAQLIWLVTGEGLHRHHFGGILSLRTGGGAGGRGEG